MDNVRVVQQSSGVHLASKASVADTWWRRYRGLLARPPLQSGEGLLLLRCSSVHTLGMKYSIDVAFLDADGVVVRGLEKLPPGRVGLGGPGAVHALELPPGRLAETGTVPGVRLTWS